MTFRNEEKSNEEYLNEIDNGTLKKLAPQYYEILTESEKNDYLNHVEKIKTIYYEEFDTVRDRLIFLLASLNSYFQTICEVRYADIDMEQKKHERN